MYLLKVEVVFGIVKLCGGSIQQVVDPGLALYELALTIVILGHAVFISKVVGHDAFFTGLGTKGILFVGRDEVSVEDALVHHTALPALGQFITKAKGRINVRILLV